MVVGYSGCYLCRSNFSVMLTSIADELVAAGLSPELARIRLGQVATVGVLAYTVGKFVTGSIADFLGGRRNVLFGMFGSVLFTILFAVSGGLPLFTLAWFGNRAVQSLCWTGMVKITGRWFSYSTYGTAMGVISLSYLFGDAAARWFMSLLIELGLGWRDVFWAAAGVLLLLTIANWLWLKESPRDIGFEEPIANPLNVYGETTAEDDPPTSLRSLLVPLLTSPEFIVVCLLSLGLTLLRETFNLWTPTYFTEVVGSSPSQAAAQSAWFPLLGGASVLLAGWIGDRLGPTGRAAVILTGSALAGIVMWALASFDFTGSTIAAVALVALVGFLMLGPYSYLAGAISLDLGGKRGAATACGIIDGVGYLGGMLAGDSVARLSVAYGWTGAFRALACVAALTSVAAAVFLTIQRRKLARESAALPLNS
jgi:OPA family glycerol-3-phosphate transporter-like MFS transporter